MKDKIITNLFSIAILCYNYIMSGGGTSGKTYAMERDNLICEGKSLIKIN
jgi:hypothetical protein